MDTAGLFSAVSLKQLAKGRGDYRTLPCSVSEQLKTLGERHGRPEPFLSVIKDQSDVSFIVFIVIFSVSYRVHRHSHLRGIISLMVCVECMCLSSTLVFFAAVSKQGSTA